MSHFTVTFSNMASACAVDSFCVSPHSRPQSPSFLGHVLQINPSGSGAVNGLAPSEGIRIWESEKFLLVESAIQEILLVGFGIQRFGIRNTTNDWISIILVPLTRTDWNPVPRIRNPRCGIQNPTLDSCPY